MTPQQSQVSKRLDRILRVQRTGGVLLVLGVAVVLLGVCALLMTVKFTPEQLIDLMRAHPGTQNIFLLLPAPDLYRLIGGAAILIGFLLASIGGLLRRGD
jgi:hypothetical protein